MATHEEERERYRKVSLRVWGDDKFRQLSSAEPNGQTLWFQLLTGPYTSLIPGVVLAGRAALAEVLGWDPERFGERFQEAADLGMAKADWKARLIWLPKGIYHNEPENPNQVKGWRPAWPTVPECALKHEVFHGLRAYMESRGGTFLQTFLETFREPSLNVGGNPVETKKQEARGTTRKREARSKKQEPDVPAASPPAAPVVALFPEPERDHPFVTRRYFEEFKAAYGVDPVFAGKEGNHVRDLLKRAPRDEVVKRMERLYRNPPAWLAKGGGSFTIGTLLANFDALAGDHQSQRTNAAGERIVSPQEAMEMAHPEMRSRETVRVQGRLVPEGES